MKTSGSKAAWVGILLAASACQTPGARGARQLSASEHSGAFATGSGNSSQGSGNSGNSSQGSGDSGNSSQGSGDSSRGSGDSSNNTNNSSNNSSDNNSNSNETSRESSEDSSGDDSSSESTQKNPVASATVIGLTAAGLGAVLWQVVAHAMRPGPQPLTGPDPEEVARAAQLYLRSRTYQLREDLALGAGPSIDDLASLARIRRENVGRFGRLLRTHRRELLALADARLLTPERAEAWLRRVGELARTDPLLEEDRRAFIATYGGQETGP
jgi:hypothetical protein